MTTNQQLQQRSRIKLIVLLLVFLLPVIAAYVLHIKPEWQPKSTKNFGTLYKPVVTLNEFSMRTQDEKAFTLADLRGKWSLVYIGKGSCDDACGQTLVKARDARLAQGAEALRINYYYLVADEKATLDSNEIATKYPKLIVLQTDAEQRIGLISQFRIDKVHQPGTDNRLYLVDPLGNVLMHYPFGFKHIGLMEDLKHLLKWSQIG